ncbi:MAG: hypothetical protein WKG00_15825 [Polyangiaceae bacterium]
MPEAALQLSALDFDAYLPERATSHAYGRPRLELKERALAWARDAAPRLAALGLRADLGASDEAPSLRNRKRVDCQWIYFVRQAGCAAELDRIAELPLSEDALCQAVHRRHAVLGLRIDAGEVAVLVALHPEAQIDLDNLAAILGEESASLRLARELRALPEQFAVSVGHGGAESELRCVDATPPELGALLSRARREAQPLCIGWRLERDVALAHVAALAEQLADALLAAAPVYQAIAWSPDNDRLALARLLSAGAVARAAARAHALAEGDRWLAEREAERSRAADVARARQGHGGAGHANRPWPRRMPPRAGLADEAPAVRAEPAPADGIDAGARVRVLAGPFTSKVGVVGELDGRGGARVLFGLLSTRVDVGDLEPAVGRVRPSLSVSHRAAGRKPR